MTCVCGEAKPGEVIARRDGRSFKLLPSSDLLADREGTELVVKIESKRLG